MWILPLTVVVNIVIALIFTDAQNIYKLKNFSLIFLAIAAIARFIPWITKSLRLYNWLKFRNHQIGFRECIRIIIYTELGAMASPTLVGGEGFYAGMLYKNGISAGESASLTSIAAVENAIFYFTGIPIAIIFAPDITNSLVSFAKGIELSSLLKVAGIACIIIIAAIIFLKNSKYASKIKSKWNEFWNEFKKLYQSMIKKGKLVFLENLLICFIHWAARYSVVFFLALGLGFELNFFKVLVLQWVVFFAMHFIPSPGASGGAEGLFLLLFNNSISESVLGTILIGWRFIDFYFLGILAVLYLGFEKYIKHVNLEEETK